MYVCVQCVVIVGMKKETVGKIMGNFVDEK